MRVGFGRLGFGGMRFGRAGLGFRIGASAFLGVLLLATGGASAQNPNTRALLEEQIGAYEELLNTRQAELDALAAELSATNVELDAQLAERDRLEAQVLELSEAQAQIRAETAQLEAQQQASAARIARLQTQAEALRSQLQDLLVALHKRRSGRYASALARSESLFELRVKNYYLSRLTDQDVALLETFERTTTELAEARSRRAEQVRALRAQAAKLEANQGALAAAQDELGAVIAALSDTHAGQLAQQQALLQEQGSIEGELTASRGALAAELERLREEAARQAALAAAEREAAASTVPETTAPEETAAFADEAARLERLIRGLESPQSTGEQDFALPFAEPEVARPYGREGATDVWLRAPQPGSAVRAVRSGVVYRTSVITANSGYTVAIQHGPNLISAYTNLQPPVVAFGDRVEQGQIIGYLGGGIVAADILQLRIGRPQGLNIIYQDPAALLELD